MPDEDQMRHWEEALTKLESAVRDHNEAITRVPEPDENGQNPK